MVRKTSLAHHTIITAGANAFNQLDIIMHHALDTERVKAKFNSDTKLMVKLTDAEAISMYPKTGPQKVEEMSKAMNSPLLS